MIKFPVLAARRVKRLGFLIAAALLAGACRSESKPAPQPVVVWKPVELVSGRGNGQTGSFLAEDAGFRVRWQTRNEAPAGAGVFKVTVNSAVSGRSLAEAIEYRGVGGNIAYVREVPRMFYLVIESSNVDWSITVEVPTAEKSAETPSP